MRVALAAALLGSLLLLAAWPQAGHAAPQGKPLHWTVCTLHYTAPGRFHDKVCRHFPLLKETRHPIGHRWTEVRHTPLVSVRVTWPRFAPVVPVYLLPGCPYAIARWAGILVPAARAYGLPVQILTGIMAIESGGDPTAYNPSGAAGLMQFMPDTAARFGINPWNPTQAIYAAARLYLQVGAAGYSGGGYGLDAIYARSCA